MRRFVAGSAETGLDLLSQCIRQEAVLLLLEFLPLAPGKLGGILHVGLCGIKGSNKRWVKGIADAFGVQQVDILMT